MIGYRVKTYAWDSKASINNRGIVNCGIVNRGIVNAAVRST